MRPSIGSNAKAFSQIQLLNKALLQKIKPAILPLLIIINVVVVFLIFRYSPISVDASYYLVISREIAEGTRPYIDLDVVYTPFVLYLFSLVFLVFEQFEYYRFITIQLITVLACAFILFQIFRKKFRLEKRTSLFLSLLFFSSVLSFEGYYIVTEPYVVFFILLSFYISFGTDSTLEHIISAIILSFSFFSKQYGIFAILPFSILVYTNSKKKINAIYFVAAFLLSVLCFFIFFSDGDLRLVFNQLFTQPLLHKSSNLNDLPSLISMLNVGKVFFCSMIPLLIRIAKRNIQFDKIMVFCFCGILIYLFPLLLNQYQHYFIITLPFVFIAYGYTIKKGSWHTYEKILLGGLFLLFSYLIINRLMIHAYKKEDQLKVSSDVGKLYKNGENVFIIGEARYLYLTNSFKDPLKRELNYTWSDEKIVQSKNLLNNKNVIFSYCYEKQLYIDSLKVEPNQYTCIEECD